MAKNATSPITSHLSKLEQWFNDQNVPYGLKNTMRCFSAPTNHFRGSKIKNLKYVIFLWGRYFMTRWPYFDTCLWMTNGCQIQNQRTKLPLGTQKSEKWLMTSSKVIDLWWPRLTSEWSQCQCKPWVSPRNTYPCSYHQQKYWSSQVSGVETVRNANFAGHDLGDQVTGQKSW